jgi:hypothetical protein
MGLGDSVQSSHREVKNVDTTSDVPMRSVNVLSLCGVVIGVAASLCAWHYYALPGYFGTYTLWDTLLHNYHSGDILFFLGSLVFMAGTAAATITPLSGLVQVTGLSMYAVKILSIAPQADGVTGVLIGFYAGAMSAAMVVMSLLVPMGPGFGNSPGRLKTRLLVFSGFGTGHLSRSRSGPRGVAKSLLANRKWVSVLVVVMLASTFLVMQDRDLYREHELLSAAGEGVLLYPCYPDKGLFTGLPWESFRLSMYQGDSVVGWTFQNDGLDDGAWSALSLGTKTLGDLNVSLTVVDMTGNGIVGLGDYVVVTAQDGTTFSDGTVYSLYWKTNRTIAWTGWEVSFVFQDGHLDSWVSEIARYGL